MQLRRRTDHVETWSPPYVVPSVARMLDVRPARGDSDQEVSLAIHNAVWPRDAVSMDELRSFQGHLVAWADHLALVDGEPVGSGYVGIRPERLDIALALVTVLPGSRGQGVGTALYDAVSAWTRGRGLERVETIVAEDDDESLAFALRRGFVEHERNLRVLLDLSEAEPPAADPPAGVEIVTWAERPELARGLYAIYAEATPDIPGQEDDEIEPYEDWLEHHMRGSGDRPEATFVAVARGEAVGYAKLSLTRAQPTVAFHDLTAVRRAWRGRGIAGALKRTQIAWAKANGFRYLQTENETRNEPIRRLNARLGYAPVPGRIFLVGPLGAGRPRGAQLR